MTQPNENTETNTSAEDTATTATEGTKADEKTFSQADVDNILRKRINEVNAKTDEKVQAAVEAALKERDRQAQLSAEEKAAEETKKREDALATREHDLLIRENRAIARELFQEKGISTELLDYVVDTDTEKTKQNFATLEKAWNKAVEAGVEKKMAGHTMTDPTSATREAKANGGDKKSTADILYGRK